jgi:hypothetical protein
MALPAIIIVHGALLGGSFIVHHSRHHRQLYGNEKSLNARLRHNFGLIWFNNDKYSLAGCSTKVFNIKHAVTLPRRGDGEQPATKLRDQ